MARLVDPRDEAPIDPTPVRAGDAIDCGVLGELMLRWWYDQFILASVHDQRYFSHSLAKFLRVGGLVSWGWGILSFIPDACPTN